MEKGDIIYTVETGQRAPPRSRAQAGGVIHPTGEGRRQSLHRSDDLDRDESNKVAASPREMLAAVYAAAGARDWGPGRKPDPPPISCCTRRTRCPLRGEWRGQGRAATRCAAAMVMGTWAKATVDIHDHHRGKQPLQLWC